MAAGCYAAWVATKKGPCWLATTAASCNNQQSQQSLQPESTFRWNRSENSISPRTWGINENRIRIATKGPCYGCWCCYHWNNQQLQQSLATRINIQLKPISKFCIIQLEPEVRKTESEQQQRVLATTNYCCNNQQSQQEIRWSQHQKQRSVNNSILFTMRTNATAEVSE